jgi:hypothetical protein
VLTKLGYHSPDGGTARKVRPIRYRPRAIAIVVTALLVLILQRGAPAPSTSSRSAAITQGEAASSSDRGRGMTLQECMVLWDAGTHMNNREWRAACKRTMVREFPADAP